MCRDIADIAWYGVVCYHSIGNELGMSTVEQYGRGEHSWHTRRLDVLYVDI